MTDAFPAGASRTGRIARAALLVLLFGLPATGAAAQSARDVPEVTRTYAIENARIVQAPGSVLPRGTVVVRDGLILAVGRDVEVPFDAARIDGDSLTVYAGFVDGLSHAGMPEPDEADGRVDDPGSPPPARAGLQPERSVRDLLDADAARIAALRRAGFTAAHVVPNGRMLPGQGSVILLSNAGAQHLVLRDDVSLAVRFAGARGVYPNTTIGVIAHLRQLYREAARRARVEALYAADPAGLERPPRDPVHTAFLPVVTGERPVFFLTEGDESALQVHRALALRDELGFRLALAGVDHASEVVDVLHRADVPVFLTLDLPDVATDSTGQAAAGDDSTEAVTPESAARLYDDDFRARSYRDVPAERRNLEARRLLARRARERGAAELHGAGIRFGFSTRGVDADEIHGALRRLIAAGLPEEAALAALTTDAAALLGLDRTLGTVEPGKIANLVVTHGSYFDEELDLRIVFVDGRKFDVDKTPEKPEGDA